MLSIVLFGCIAVAWSAPTEHLAAPLTAEIKQFQPFREFLVLTPDAQLQLQPSFKLQQPVLQPLALYGSASTRQQTNPGWCNIVAEIATNIENSSPFPLPWLDGIGSKNDEEKKLQQQMPQLNTDAETIPNEMNLRTPASTFALPEHRFYTIAGRPQFFGNVDILQNPMHPIFSLQPLQAIRARSVANPIAEINQNQDHIVQTILPSESVPSPQPLRINEEEIQREQLQTGDAARNFAKFLYDQKFINPQPEHLILGPAVPEDIAQKFAQRFADSQLSELEKEDPSMAIAKHSSIAEARPVALAITGKGGLAQAGPISTAVVGKNGLAIADPTATSIAGQMAEESPAIPAEEDKKEPALIAENKPLIDRLSNI